MNKTIRLALISLLMLVGGLWCSDAFADVVDRGYHVTTGKFYTWEGFDANAVKGERTDVSYGIGSSLSGGDVVIGDVNVTNTTYADLTGSTKLTFKGSEGTTLRVLLNRQSDDSWTERNPTIGADGKAEVDVSDLAYVHLNCIKIAWSSSGTVTEVRYVKPVAADAPAEYLLDTDFASLESWLLQKSASFCDKGNGLIGSWQVKSDLPAATVDDTHLASEYCIGMELRWNSSYVRFLQTTTDPLPAGKYALTYDVMNANSGTVADNYDSYFSVTVGETVYTDQSTEWAQGGTSWTTHTVPFTLTEEGDITVCLGWGTNTINRPHTQTPALYVSHLKLINMIDVAREQLTAEIAYAVSLKSEASRTSGLTDYNQAIDAATAALAGTDADEVFAAVTTLQEAEAAFIEADTVDRPHTQVADGTYYLYNVGANKFLTSGNYWGTHAALDDDGMAVTLAKVADGTYTISTNVAYAGKYLGDNAYMDNATAAQWVFELANDKQQYTLKNGDNYLVSVNNHLADLTTKAPNTALGYWQVISREQLVEFLSTATEDNPVDASFYMTNPKMRRNWPYAFQGTDLNDRGGFNANVEGLYNGGCQSMGQYHKTFDTYQELSGLEPGHYLVSVKGFYRQDGTGNDAIPYLYANDATTPLLLKGDIGVENSINATKALVDDTYLVSPVNAVVRDGALRVGVKSDDVVGWATWREYTLSYYPFSDAELCAFAVEDVLQPKIDVCETLYANSAFSEGRDAFDAAINAAKAAALSATSVSEINEAAETLEQARLAFLEANKTVEDGVYYIYNAYSKKFLSRGETWGTRAIGDDFGLPINVTNTDGKYTLQMVDNGGYYGDDYWMYADCSDTRVRSYYIKSTEGGFYLRNSSRDVEDNRVYIYLKDDADKYCIAGNAILGDNIADDAQTVWQFLTPEEYAAHISARIAEQNTAAVTGAGYEAEAEFEAVGETTELTFKTGSNWVFTAKRNYSSATTNEYGTEVFEGTGTFTQTVTGLQQGVYKVGIQAFYRNTANTTTAAIYDLYSNICPAKLDANGTLINIKSWAADRTSNTEPDRMWTAAPAFDEGKYLSEGYAFVGEDGKLELTVTTPAYASASWFIASNVKYTRLEDAAFIQLCKDAAAEIASASAELEKDFMTEGRTELTGAIDAVQTALDAATYATRTTLAETVEALQAAVAAFADANNPAPGKYYLQNKAAALFWGAGNDWGTQASLVEHPEYVVLSKLSGGLYQMEAQVSNGGTNYYFNGDYMDNNSPMSLTFTKVAANTWTIGNGAALFGYDGTTVLGKNLSDATADAAQWIVTSEADMLASLNAATADAPVDATFLILDPNFGRNNRNQSAWTFEADNQNISGGANNNRCAESYHSLFTLSQTLGNAPAGVYALQAQGFYRQDGTNTNLPVFYANDDYLTDFPEKTGTENSMTDASNSFSAGLYTIDELFVKVENDGELTIGAKNEENTALWCIFDNFTLKYYGTDADGLVLAQQQDVYKTLLAEAKRTRQKMGTDERAALTAAINADKDLDKENLSDLNAAIAALRPVLAAAKTSVTLYAEAKPVIKEIRETLAKTNVYTNEAYFTFMEDFTPYRERYDNGTFTSEDLTYLTYEVMPHNKGWHKANTIDDLLLSGWQFNGAEAKEFNTSLYINTWSVEGDTDGTGFTTPFYEYWTDDANKLGAAELTNTISDLEPGVYNVTLWGRVRLQNGQEAPAENGITLLVNDNEAQMADLTGGTQVGEGQFYIGEFTATGEVGEDRALTIKIKVNDDNNISWLSFKNVKFLFDAAKTQQNDDADQLKNAKADLEALIASINNMGLGKYTNETATNAENAAANAAAALEGDNLTLADISEQKSLLNKALQALEIREQSSALYAVQVGETHTSAETVEVTAQDNDEVVAYLTFGVEGGNDFKAGQANTYVDGYVAFTAGNGDNGGIDRGTVYFIKPVYDGVIEVSVALNGGKAFYIAEDGVNKEAFNGDKVTEKYYGPALFNVERNKTYAIWCAGSKLGFYGFNYYFGQGIDPIDETQLSIVTRLNGVTMDFSNGAVYNLNGQKMDNTGNLRPGLYIINGKKVVKK